MFIHKLRFGLISSRAALLAPDKGGAASGSSTETPDNPDAGSATDEGECDGGDNGEGGDPAAGEEEGKGDGTAASAKKPSVWERAGALLKGKEALASEISGYKARIAELEAQLDVSNATIERMSGELAELRAGRDSLEKTVQALEAEKKTVEQGVTDALASIGQPQDVLPGADAGDNSGKAEFDKWCSLSGAEKFAYFRRNKAKIEAYVKANPEAEVPAANSK